jgi:heme/copper-type cytochrome/quinol oxidase subunit 1
MTAIDTHAASADTAAPALASLADWITTTDHKRIGRLYIGAALIALIGAGVVGALLAFERIDTATTFLNLGSLTQLFSLYRWGLLYLAAVPLVVGVAVAIVPLQLGARSIAFPRLAIGGFWMWLFGAVASIVALIGNGGPNGGNARFVDLFTLAVALSLVGLVASLVSVLTSILTTRAPGMNIRRLSAFSWSVLVMGLCALLALPVIVGLLLYVYIAHKYPSISDLSGNHALEQWVGFGFTHPTTVLFTIPVFGFAADAVSTAAKRRLRPRGVVFATIGLVGVAVVGASVQTPVVIRAAFRSLSGNNKAADVVPFLFVHGLPLLGAFLTLALVLQAVAAKPKPTAPMVGGVLAALLALLAVAAGALLNIGDAGLAGTVFEEGTFLLSIGAVVVFAIAAITQWLPKWTGRSVPALPGIGLAVLAFLGSVLAAAPMLIAGFADQPGGIFPAVEQGVDGVVKFSYSGPSGLWNALSGVGLALLVVSALAFSLLAVRSASKGATAGDDPWDGQTLEWATTSPAPANNFASVPVVTSAEPLLDLKSANTRSDA